MRNNKKLKLNCKISSFKDKEDNAKRLKDSVKVRKLGKMARERVLGGFDWEKIIKEYVGVLG